MTATSDEEVASLSEHLGDGGQMPSASNDNNDSAEEVEDRPRFCSFNPPEGVYRDYPHANDGVADLCSAAHRGQLKEVITLVERYSVDVAKKNEDGKSAVHIASRQRHCHDVLRYLLEAGASVSARDSSGSSPLHIAASSRNAVGIEVLLQFGAEVDARDRDSRTPLFLACQAVAHKIIAQLLEGGANPAIVGGENAQSPLHALVYSSTPGSLQASPKNKAKRQSPMHAPLLLALTETVDKMVKAGAPHSVADSKGLTVLDAAAACHQDLLRHMMVGCDLEPRDILVYAARFGDTSIAEQILGGGNVEPWTVIDEAGNSLLHLAAAAGSLECVVLLLTGKWLEREGAMPLNIDARDTMGQTALFKAAFNAHTEIAAFLLDYGASPTIQDCSGVGVGYTFAETVTGEQRVATCELLQKWGGRNEEERVRADSAAVDKAPEGDVIYLSGVVPLVEKSKTKHLWTLVDEPPRPGRLPPNADSGGSRVGGRERGLTPVSSSPPERPDTVATYCSSSGRPLEPTEVQRATRHRPDDTFNPWRAIGRWRAGKGTNPDLSVTLGVEVRSGEPEVAEAQSQQKNTGRAKYVAGNHRQRRARSETAQDSTDTQERNARAISTASQQSQLSAGSAQSMDSAGPDGERCHRELSRGQKARVREGRRKGARRNISSAASERHAEEPVVECSGVPTASEPGYGCTSVVSASPRGRNWKLRPRVLEDNVLNSTESAREGTARRNGEEEEGGAPGPANVTPAPPLAKPNRRTKTFW